MNRITKYELSHFASIIIFVATVVFLQTDIIAVDRNVKTSIGIIFLCVYIILIELRQKEAKKLPSSFSSSGILKIPSFRLAAVFIVIELFVLQKTL